MRTLFSIFVFGVMSSVAFGTDICLKPDGCSIDIDTGVCTECVSLTPENFPAPTCVEKRDECAEYLGVDLLHPRARYCRNGYTECVLFEMTIASRNK